MSLFKLLTSDQGSFDSGKPNAYVSESENINDDYYSDHSIEHVNDISDIPQYDGNLSLPDPNPDHDHPVGTIPRPGDVLTRIATFELNKEKQTASIYRDAHVEDFKIISKDHDRSISIECSSGFYAQVAKPTLFSLSQDSIPPVLGITIFCENVTTNLDKNGFEFNRTMFFKLANAKKVTVHVHHSTRLVQAQGGSLMSDKTTAAFWFVKNVLKGKFRVLASAKKYNIKNFNDALTTSHTLGQSFGAPTKDKCGACDKVLDSRSAPVYCFLCTKQFHKINCHKKHHCIRYPASTSGVVTTNTSVGCLTPHSSPLSDGFACSQTSSNASQATPQLSCSSPTTFRPAISSLSSVTVSPPTSSSTTVSVSSPPPIAHSVTTAPRSSPSLNTNTPRMISFLDPRATTFNPPTSALRQESSRRANKKQKSSDLSSEQAEIESLKIELSYARTKIVDLETKIDDGKETLKVYSHKLKILEENRSSFLKEKYFSSKDQADTSPLARSPSETSNLLECSCQVRAKISKNSAKLQEFEMKISELCSIVDGLSRTNIIPDRTHGLDQSPSAPRRPSSSSVVPGSPVSPATNVPLQSTQTVCPTDSVVDSLEDSSETGSSDFIFSDTEDPVSRPSLN